jgi:hypothetical protein
VSRKIASGDQDGDHLGEGRRRPYLPRREVERWREAERRERGPWRGGRGGPEDEGPCPRGRREKTQSLAVRPCRVQDLGRSLPPLDGLDEAPPVVLCRSMKETKWRVTCSRHIIFCH